MHCLGKVTENCRQQQTLKRDDGLFELFISLPYSPDDKLFEKKYFLDFGKSPISTPDFQNFIFLIKKYYPKDHYKTIFSGFGPAGCMWQRSELRIGEK